jgi:hypothetical protein
VCAQDAYCCASFWDDLCVQRVPSVCYEACVPGQCTALFGDCDGIAANGCEAPLDTLQNCGACGSGCALANAITSCASGTCALVGCNAGFGSCDGNPQNGCETSLTTVTDCIGCGTACDDGNPCTVDACDAAIGCVHTPVADGTPCDDGSACTQLDACQAGACTGASPITQANACSQGEPLPLGCDACVNAVCAEDPYCCATFWDAVCVAEVASLCADPCPTTCAGGIGGCCAHDLCLEGEPNPASCDPCAQDICSVDPYCCAAFWDSQCVSEVTSLCARACVGCSGGGGPGCTHDVCAEGGPLPAGSTPCTAAMCATDPYCCTAFWDADCVAKVPGTCGVACPP